ncbi:MAG: SURF1 family protein [Pseudomonadota bacterium]
MTDSLKNYVFPSVFAACAFAVLISLGAWQVERLGWKEELIARATERPRSEPVPAPGPATWSPFDFDRYDYMPVRMTGRFGPDEVHVYMALTSPRGPRGGQGYWVVAPFETVDGWTVVVNRGFVPESHKDPSTRPSDASSDGEQTLVGLIRRPGLGNRFTPENDIAKNVWYARDPAAIGQHFGIAADRLAPYSVDLVAAMTPPGGLPQAGETRQSFSNNHLQYAVTWFGLAATLVGVYGFFMLARFRAARQGRGDSDVTKRD